MSNLDPNEALWIHGEWATWDEMPDLVPAPKPGPGRLQRLPKPEIPVADAGLIPHFFELLGQAESYFLDTGQHLEVYEDIAMLFAAALYGISVPSVLPQQSIGVQGHSLVDMRTIAPYEMVQSIPMIRDKWFEKLLVVRITPKFEVRGKLFQINMMRKAPMGRYWIAYDEPVGDEIWVPSQASEI